MDELVKLVQQKTGISEAQAKQAVETVVGFLKEKLPPALAGQVDGLLANDAAMGRATDALGGMLGKLGK